MAAAMATSRVKHDVKALTNERVIHLRLLEAKRQQIEHLWRLIPWEKLMKLQVKGDQTPVKRASIVYSIICVTVVRFILDV